MKEQEWINRDTNGNVRAYMEENAHVMPQGKTYAVFNSRDVIYRTNSSKLKTQFTPNHKEADIQRLSITAVVLTNHA